MVDKNKASSRRGEYKISPSKSAHSSLSDCFCIVRREWRTLLDALYGQLLTNTADRLVVCDDALLTKGRYLPVSLRNKSTGWP